MLRKGSVDVPLDRLVDVRVLQVLLLQALHKRRIQRGILLLVLSNASEPAPDRSPDYIRDPLPNPRLELPVSLVDIPMLQHPQPLLRPLGLEAVAPAGFPLPNLPAAVDPVGHVEAVPVGLLVRRRGRRLFSAAQLPWRRRRRQAPSIGIQLLVLVLLLGSRHRRLCIWVGGRSRLLRFNFPVDPLLLQRLFRARWRPRPFLLHQHQRLFHQAVLAEAAGRLRVDGAQRVR
mmetsp:Transcript_2150/g.9385  ORF Transcript_2150/g.9385 Transcript_2150/m.9385 type:complete len:231 (+) Transcript_2150:1109-1801(+)